MGHCLLFDTLDEVKSYMGVGHVVLSKLALLTKLEKADCPATPGRRGADGKHLLRLHGALEWLVVDVAHAFHNLPIRPSDRQFMCGKGTRFLVFKVLGMGPTSGLQLPFVA